ncbi:hypothetical protein GCM10027421_09590 [Microbacterium shaanxiense]
MTTPHPTPRRAFAVSAIVVSALAFVAAVGLVVTFNATSLGMAVISATAFVALVTAVLVIIGVILSIIAFVRHEPRRLTTIAVILAAIAAIPVIIAVASLVRILN